MKLTELSRAVKTPVNRTAGPATLEEQLMRDLHIAYVAEEAGLDENVAKWIMAFGLTALTAGGMGAAYDYVKSKIGQDPTAVVAKAVPRASEKLLATALKPLEKALLVAASNAGIDGHELKQFMAQCAHETGNWTSLEEVGNHRYFLKKYDPKHNPRVARMLGNVSAGDGIRFKGRGYIQLTGRDNYAKASQAIYGDDRLVRNPELVSKPEVAAKTSIWFWQNRVAPKVADYTDTKLATKPINPGLRGLSDRANKFAQYTSKAGS